jgi:UDP-galactopyranose mutase
MNKEEQKKLITEIMNEDAKDGLYTQLTAVEWIYGKLVYEQTIKNYTQKEWRNIFKQAKAMEKGQIIQAHLSGLLHPLEMEATKQAEQYYKKTYN